MQYLVPQFIEVESKVIGPISVRQFIILLVTAGFMWIFWTIFTFWIAVILAVLSLAIGGAFAFVRINSQPFHIFALSYIQTLKNPNLKVWHREAYKKNVIEKDGKNKKTDQAFVPKERPTQSRLTELSLLVDTGGVYKPEELAEKVKTTARNKDL